MARGMEGPEWDGTGWIITGPAAARLNERGRLGERLGNQRVRLTDTELFHAIRHRGVHPPQSEWMNEALMRDSQFLHLAEVLSALRAPGELYLPLYRTRFQDTDCWAMRWNAGDDPKTDAPASEVRWSKADEEVNWFELGAWTMEALEKKRSVEQVVIDDEGDITRFVIEPIKPSGNHGPPSDAWSGPHLWLDQFIASGEGYFLPASVTWPFTSIGRPCEGGWWLDALEHAWVTTSGELEEQHESILGLFTHLVDKGLQLRPGFKYGTRWRAYEDDIDDHHAPYLITPIEEAPRDWNGACRASRLASGVKKQWCFAFWHQDEWSLIKVRRRRPGASHA